MGLWLLIAFAVAISAVFGFRVLARRAFLKQRTPLPLEELHTELKENISFEVFREVWTAVGKAYGIDPKLIRPNDTFLELSKMDSWVLGKGEDNLAEWLDKKGLGRPVNPKTVLDVATWMQSVNGTRA